MQYELLYIIPATVTDEEVGTTEALVKALLEKYGATLDTTNRLGKFRLAYPVKNIRHGHYVLVRFTCEGTAVAKIEEGLRISQEVLRHLILRAEEAGTEKFDLVQFNEINIEAAKEAKDARRREKAEKAVEDKAVEDKAEDKKEDAAPAATASTLTDEDIDKKIDQALTEDKA